MPVAQLGGAAAPYRVPVYITCTLLALITNYFLGKDMAWDTLHYHLYAGFSVLNDRFAQDYFAAGPQSYFNPYVYLPFYALVTTGLSALEIGSVLAAAHSIILWLTYELAVSVCPSDDARTRFLFGICGVALAFANPILMQQLGSTFADITTAELVLAGWLLLAGAVRAPNLALVVIAGLLLGATTGLKLTNAVHAIAALGILIFLPLPPVARLRDGALYVVSLGIGFAGIAAPWSYRLERMFGNPVFPLMNNVFRSPEFTTEPLRHFRFIPDTVAEALWRPFKMLDPVSMVHEELRAPDLRYAVLAALAVTALSLWLWRRRSQSLAAWAAPTGSARVLAALSCGFGADWIIWLQGSGNGRYFLPMACVAAIVIMGLLFRIFETRPKVRNYILVVIFVVQALQLWKGTDYRWNAAPWGGQWLEVNVPEKLRTEPNLYFTEGTQSNSFIAPYLATNSGLINFSGSYALGPTGANGAHIAALIGRYGPHIRVLIRGEKLYDEGEDGEPRRSQVDMPLARFGMRTDAGDCDTITVKGVPSDPVLALDTSTPLARSATDTTFLLSCRLVHDSQAYSAEIAQQRAADLVLDRLEDACPKLFQPRRPLSEHRGRGWIRYYANTDLWAWVSDGWVKYYQAQRGKGRAFVGREESWARAPLRITCGRQGGIYSANVVDSNEQP
jgi:hypothetical protein